MPGCPQSNGKGKTSSNEDLESSFNHTRRDTHTNEGGEIYKKKKERKKCKLKAVASQRVRDNL